MARSTPKIFISYRRDDTAAPAGRIYDRLCQILPRKDVFIDVNEIGGGEKFEQRIIFAMSQSSVVLIFIGPKWLIPLPGSDRSRLWNEGDYVRKEIQLALEGAALVLPLLVDGAAMPAPADLPDVIRPLTERNALPLRHNSFDDDAENVLAAVVRAKPRARIWDKKSSLFAKIGFSAVGMVAGAILLAVAALIHQSVLGRPLAASIGVPLTDLVIFAVPLSGAILGLVFALRRRF